MKMNFRGKLKHVIMWYTSCIVLIFLCNSCKNNSNNAQSGIIKNKPDTLLKKNTTSDSFHRVNNNLDSIDSVNSENVIASGNDITKAYVSNQDSSITLTANIRLSHRIFGYAKPDIKSERLLLLSIFTNDVEGNPFKCKLGSYYDTDGMQELTLKYLKTNGDFIEAVAINKAGGKTIIYFEKKWMEFD